MKKFFQKLFGYRPGSILAQTQDQYDEVAQKTVELSNKIYYQIWHRQQDKKAVPPKTANATRPN